MADFSAVIRRAIEGLSTNTPEDRERIYERARATIQRQLDSLPEGLNRSVFESQLDKIENSILEIEQEYAGGATVPDDAPITQSQPEPVAPPPERFTPQPPIIDKSSTQPSVENSVVSPDVADVTPAEPAKSTVAAISGMFHNRIGKPSTSSTPSVPETAPLQEDVVDAPTQPIQAPEPIRAPEPVVEPPVVEVPEVSLPVRNAPEAQVEDAEDIVEPVEVEAPTRFDHSYSSETAIDSELEIPKAPQPEAFVQTPVHEPVEAPLNDAAILNNDANLIDKAVNEIRSNLQDDKPSSADPNLSFGFGEEALPEAPVPKQRKSPVVIVIAVLLLLFVALAFFFWRVGGDGLQELLSQSKTDVTEVSDSQVADVPKEQPVTPEQTDESATPTNEVASASGEVEKFTQRLNSDGSEVDEGPASDLIDGLPNEEGRSVAAANVADDAKPSEPVAAQADDGTPALQKMFFYETSLGLEQQAKYEGSVVWSEKTESDSEKSRPYIEGMIQVPERNISIVMTIKLNGDDTLPVSHLIDLSFSLPDDFDGGEIEQITEVKFKSSEEQTGDRLIAISAKIDKSFFVVGLENDKLDVVESNLELMSQRDWIDIPISYTNGRKALIALEKGATGKAIFDKVLAYWKQHPV